MTTEVICAIITGIAGIIIAYVGVKGERRSKRAERRSIEREKIYGLQMKMQTANIELSKAIAVAIKRGYPNGEIEAAFHVVEEVEAEKNAYLESLAVKKL